MDRLLFVVALCVCSFLFGAASIHLKTFPYHQLREAKLALKAWLEVEEGRFPKAFQAFEPSAPPRPLAKPLQGSAGKEHILVTGGPYQLMERCPTYGCLAWIADREGRVVHAWEVDLPQLWDGMTGVSGEVDNPLNFYPVGMHLAGDGSLLVTFQGRNTFPVGIGLAKIDRDGAIVWKRFDSSHHWLTVDENGHIYTPYAIVAKGLKHFGDTPVEIECHTDAPVLDGIRVLSAEGNVVRELALMPALVRAGLAGLFYGLRDGCDVTHLNSIARVTPAVAEAIPDARVGDLLISLREASAVALLDGQTGDVKRVLAGRTAAQHAPQFLPDGTVLAFDNLGGNRDWGGTRVMRLNLVNGSAETVFPRGNEKSLLPVRSETAGHINVSADGTRALIAVTHQGRIIEIDVASGAPLWVYENTHDIGPFLQANKLDSKTTRARFATYGAYYVGNLAFLDKRQTAMAQGEQR